ncbi:zinc finger, CCHC-type containing protein [Tanacetum coccineum]
MGDANPICTLEDYSKPSHEGYRNTIELLVGNNVVPLQSDTIWLVQNGCSFHGLWSEDPNKYLKDFLKLVDLLDLDGENKERTCLHLFQFSLHDQARNWLERLPTGSITTWEDLTTHPQCSTHIHGSINTVTIHPKQQSDIHDDEPAESEEEEKDSPENTNTNPSGSPDPSVSFITENVLKINSFFKSLDLAPQLSGREFVCTKGDDGDVMFIEIVKKNGDSRKEEPEAGGLEVEYFDMFPTQSELAYHKYLIKLDPRKNSDGGVSNFKGRIKGMHVFLGNFTYVIDFMIVEDISSIIDPRLSQVVLGKPFIGISNMTYDPLEGVIFRASIDLTNTGGVCSEYSDPVEATRRRAKWESDDYICRGHILNGMSDLLFDIYQNVESAKELWDSLESNYMVEDASSKKFLVSNFNNYKMVNSRLVMEQFNELLRILGQLMQLRGRLIMVPQLMFVKIVAGLRHMNRFCYVYLLHAKDEALDKFRIYKTEVELQQNDLIKNLRMDRDGEYYNPVFFQSVGIIHETTTPYTPQKNGVVERKNRALKEMVNSMLSYSGLSEGFWREAMLIGCYLLNMVPNKRNKTTPYELWYKKRPNLPFLWVWGCRAVVRLSDTKRKTLSEKGIDCIFVGYAEHSKSYRFYVIEPNDSVSINSIIESRDAIFDENHFSSIPRPKEFIPNSDESQRDDHSNDVPSETLEPRREYPRTYNEAMQSRDVAFWKKEINDEIGSIMENNTWVLSDLPPCCKPLGCKWIFKRKMKVDGIIDKFKARLVIKGFRQKEGIDYFDTYVPVSRITTI